MKKADAKKKKRKLGLVLCTKNVVRGRIGEDDIDVSAGEESDDLSALRETKAREERVETLSLRYETKYEYF